MGKSTFFNRLIEERQAITDNVAGTTRDRHYGKAEWNGVVFSVVDTGGYISGSDDVFEGVIRKQVNLAIEESDSIIFLVDVHHGLTGMDEAIAAMLRRAKKPVLLAANKVDDHSRQLFNTSLMAADEGVDIVAYRNNEYFHIQSKRHPRVSMESTHFS